MDKLREELSAAVALTTLGVPPVRTQLLRPQVPFDVLEMQMQHHIRMNNKLKYERSLAAAVAPQEQRREAFTSLPQNSREPRRNFAQKLFDVLSTGLHSDIIRWLPGGKAFIVLDKRRFANEILPNYFKDSQYTSFTRKLSRWKFTRVSRGPYMGAYYHRNFRSDNRGLCKLMSCNNNKLNEKEDETDKQKGKAEQMADVEKIIMESEENDEDLLSRPRSTSTKEENTVKDQNDLPSPPSSRISGSKRAPSSTPEELKSNMLNQVTTLENSMNNTNQNILEIKKQLMDIRLRKAQVEEKKQILMIQAAEARRLKEIQRLRRAVDLSIQQAESHIIAAAARALDRSNRHRIQGHTHERPLCRPGILHQSSYHISSHQNIPATGNFKRRQLLNSNVQQLRNHNHASPKPTRISRAFAA